MCAKGVSMSWVHFLVEEFRLDFLEAQEWKKKFHYSWLLILITLVGWAKPPDYVFSERMIGRCEAIKYANLWYSSIEERRQDNNACFVIYHMNIEVSFRSAPRMSDTIVKKYELIVAFKADMHYIYVRARLDPSWTWLPLPYQVSDSYLEKEISEWKEDWRPAEVPLSYPKKKKKKTTPADTVVTARAEQQEKAVAMRKGKE